MEDFHQTHFIIQHFFVLITFNCVIFYFFGLIHFQSNLVNNKRKYKYINESICSIDVTNKKMKNKRKSFTSELY